MSTEPLPFATRVVRATKGSGSLRATVPQVVAATLALRAGDRLSWIVDPVTSQVRVERVVRPEVRGRSPNATAEGTDAKA